MDFYIDSNFWGLPSIKSYVYKDVDGGQLLKIYLPGIKKEDILVKVEKDFYLCVEFKDEDSKQVRKKFSLLEEVDVEKIKAEYKDGVLEIFLPEKESFTKIIPIA